MTSNNIKNQMNHLSLGIKHQRSSSSPPINALSGGDPSSASATPNMQSPLSPLSPPVIAKGVKPINPAMQKYSNNEQVKTSFEQLKDALGDYEFDGEVVIKDVDSEEYSLYYGDRGGEDDYTDDTDDTDDAGSESMEEEEIAIVKSSPPIGRNYSHSVSGYAPSPTRHERSESTIIHPGVESQPIKGLTTTTALNRTPSKVSVTVTTSSTGSMTSLINNLTPPSTPPSSTTSPVLSPINNNNHNSHLVYNQGASSPVTVKQNDRANQFKEAISSEYKKMLDNPDEFRAEKLKQRKSKFFTKEGNQPPEVSSMINKPLSGMTLESVITRENNRDGGNKKVPLLVTKCIEYLSIESALKTEGLFRVAGNQSEVETLMKSLLQHGYDIPTGCCVHVVASTLKKFLRQLQVPVFTFKYHHEFINRFKITNDYERLQSLKKLILELPDYNQRIVNQVIKFLALVTKHSTINMMHAHNLGLMFGPTMMKAPDENEMSIMLDTSSQVITYLIENYSQLFQME
ncbi:RhoGAP domain-containing protein [Cavenderia fasciculata]|uniref:RhoGAP domain-containing protein n=1 Tax=Cavenderia fasciculata TaxID=261658 RepID=F4QAL3_CACFS|nr:RhoGAP domain-containing protein [Cavenderia fasciculata]EGG15732.1 RhoGAP domain-containing protein [Cavenderia fasciculata]|eukprot:XP_004354474.1 RhoGAP domain-containing protein [Cavenderia fasciculata]